MSPTRFVMMMLAAAALTAAGSLAGARPHDDDRKAKDGRERQEQVERPKARISLDEAVARAEKRFNARVVRAESQNSDTGLVYVLRLLNDSGRVWTVKVDAASGAMH